MSDDVFQEPRSDKTPLLKLDYEKYRDHLAEFEMTEDEQNAFMEAMWSIMTSMVAMGWGLDEFQLFSMPPEKSSGQDSENTLTGKERVAFNEAASSQLREGKA